MPSIKTLRTTLGAALLAFGLPALAGPIGYSAWDVSGTDKLVRFDLTTGVGTVIGRIQNASGTEGYSDVDGLAFDGNGQLWAVNDSDNTLLRIDATTGTAVEVGSLGSGINDMGLAFVGGTLYMSSTSAGVGHLYTVNTSTGATTLVGSSGATLVRSLGAFNGQLFGWSNSDTLLSINTATGAAALLGAFGFVSATVGHDGMDIDPGTGTLWGLGDAEARTYTLNTTTGAATFVAQQVCFENNVANANCSGGGFSGLAIARTEVPEPTSLALAGLALLGLGATRRRASAAA